MFRLFSRACRAPRTRLLVAALEQRDVPATFTVQNLNDSGTGSLRACLEQANLTAAADVIDFQAGLSGTISVQGQMDIKYPVSLNYAGPGRLNLISPSGPFFDTSSAPAKAVINLTGLQMNGGLNTDNGGALVVSDESVTLNNCAITNSISTENGGAIAVMANGAIVLNDCELTGNSSDYYGGAIYAAASASIEVHRSQFSNNDSFIGGAISQNAGGSLTIESSSLTHNKAVGGGFGIASDARGGAVYIAGNATNFLVRNSTISNNFGTGYGGILWETPSGTLLVQNSTIVQNSSGFGSVTSGIQVTGNATTNIHSSVIASNGGLFPGDISSGGAVSAHNSAIGVTNGFTLTGSNNIFPGDLKLGDLALNGGITYTHRPEAGSPLIGGGSNIAGLTLDQRGAPRLLGGGIDIGAVEALTPLVVTNDADAGPGSLRENISFANLEPDDSTITFDSVFFGTPRTITLTSGELTTTRSLTIDGRGAQLTSISGNKSGRLFNMAGQQLILDGLTLTGASASGGSVVHVGNIGDVTMTNCAVMDNSSTFGSQIYFAKGGDLTVDGSTFANNVTGNRGGAMYLAGATTATLRNCTISANQAGVSGGGIATENVSGSVTIQNSTIVNNIAGIGSGGGIAMLTGTGTLKLESSIVAQNSNNLAPDISSSVGVSATKSAIGSSKGANLTTTDCLPYGTNLKLSPLALNGGTTLSHLPDVTSPVVNAGSNPASLSLDQRGVIRSFGPSADIGSVEANYGTINSIVRLDPTPNSGATVRWTVNLAAGTIGVNPANFTLTGTAAASASIQSVTGANKTWTVTAVVGGDGFLGLSFTNNTGLNLPQINVPFAGEVYVIDRAPVTAVVNANQSSFNVAAAGADALTLTAVYSEAMDTNVFPSFSFPTEMPGAAVAFSSGAWANDTTFVAHYHVLDTNLELANIDVMLTGGKDQVGGVYGQKVHPDVFSIDMVEPVCTGITRLDANPAPLGILRYAVTFSEPTTGVVSGNFALATSGLSGSAITNVLGGPTNYEVQVDTGVGGGTLRLDMTNSLATDAAGNPVLGLTKTGQTYDITVANAPKVQSVTINGGAAQRSRVTSLMVEFDQTVDLPGNAANAFQLSRVSDGAIVGLSAIVIDGVTTSVQLTFLPGAAVEANSLADGRYQLTALSNQVTGPGGNLDGDTDGQAGGDYQMIGNPATNTLFRLFGDANGDGYVDASDFSAFRSAFGTSSLVFDFDANGNVDGSDFAAFRARFGSGV